MTIDRINSDFDRVRERYKNDVSFHVAANLFFDGYSDEYVKAFVDLDADSLAAAKKFGNGMKRLSDMLDSLDEKDEADL